MMKVNGWWLPDGDRYFAPFAATGFQTDHLQAAYKHIKEWRFAVDVGAHIGFWAKEMAKLFDVVYAIEPAPDTYECLRENLYGQTHVCMINAAAGSKPGRCKVNEDRKRLGNTGARFITADGDVPVITIDGLNLLHCDLLKIDVEGFEHEVLAGARDTIAKFKPAVIMETDKRFAKDRYGAPDDAAEKALVGMGYRVAEHIRPDKVFVPK